MSINVDAYAWSMSASVSGAQALALIQGAEGEPVEVDVHINGTTWRVAVDSWSLTEAWQQRGGTIRGRSKAAYLASPYAATRDYQEAELRQAQQLATQELPPGWTLTWGIDDWLVPGGAWQYQNLAPIDAISRLAAGGAGYVQADRTGDTLHIRPLYAQAPWDWHLLTPDVALPPDIIVQRGSEYSPGDPRNAVFVHGGQEGGILARVLRTGSAGDKLAPTIVDSLITATEPARARGIAALAATGRQARETYELPLSASLGGLLEPGAIVARGADPGTGFVEDWRGIVRGVTVDARASRASNGGGALQVRQSVEIERHYGEAA
jgi:hypothetical protein